MLWSLEKTRNVCVVLVPPFVLSVQMLTCSSGSCILNTKHIFLNPVVPFMYPHHSYILWNWPHKMHIRHISYLIHNKQSSIQYQWSVGLQQFDSNGPSSCRGIIYAVRGTDRYVQMYSQNLRKNILCFLKSHMQVA